MYFDDEDGMKTEIKHIRRATILQFRNTSHNLFIVFLFVATLFSRSSMAIAQSASPDGTVIPSASEIIDTQGNVWTLSQGAVLKNNAYAGYTANVVKLAYVNGMIYHENSQGSWYCFTGTGTTQWAESTYSPFPISPNGMTIPANAYITDSQGNVWTLTSQTVLENSVPAGYTANVMLVAVVGGTIYQENTQNQWFFWNGSGWTGATNPLAASASGATIPSAPYLIDTQGSLWTLSAQQTVLRNGTEAGYTANAIQMSYVNGMIYHKNAQNQWFGWNGNGWTYTGTNPRPATVYWGADGHRDKADQTGQDNPYQDVPLSQQIADLKNIFGNTPNTIFYRAWDSIIGHESDVTELQAAGIIPIISMITYPDWYSFSSESDAYNWAYSQATEAVKAAPTATYWIVGNEWTDQPPISGEITTTAGSVASDWTNLKSYPLYRGAAAGAIAAIRDNIPNAQIIGGASTDFYRAGFADALAKDLENYGGRNLTWDYTSLHWYVDVASVHPNGSDGGNLGMPDDYYNNYDAYTLLNPTGKPLFVDELGSSDGGITFNDAAAGNAITGLMQNFLANAVPSSSAQGIVGGTIYQLYQYAPSQQSFLYYHVPGESTTTLAPQGAAVKNWASANANPSTNSGPEFSLSGSDFSVGAPGQATITVTVTPLNGFTGQVGIACSAQSVPWAGGPGTPTCTVSSVPPITGDFPVSATVTVVTSSSTQQGGWVLTITGTGGGASTDTNLNFSVN